jgi:dipeptidyl-peptidase-4
MRARYERADALSTGTLLSQQRNRWVDPTWTGEGDAFTYVRDGEAGQEVVRIDPDTAERAILGAPPAPAPASMPRGIRSRDGKHELVRRGHDLWIVDVATVEERELLGGGEAHFAWGALVDATLMHLPLKPVRDLLAPVGTSFSPSGRWVMSVRIDERSYLEWPMVEHLPANGVRPVLHPIRNVLAGEAPGGDAELAFVDLATEEHTIIGVGPEIAQALVFHGASAFAWSEDETELYVLNHSLGARTAELVAIDTSTGEKRVAVSETADPLYEPNSFLYSLPLIRVLPEAEQVIWFSQRDGWGHLYLYDLTTGTLVRRLTHGELVVRDLLHVDEATRTALVAASSGVDGHNPYWRTLYRLDLDAGEQVLLTPEPMDHFVAAPAPPFMNLITGATTVDPISPSGRHVVVHSSTVDAAPVITLRSTVDGHVVRVLERTDVSALLAAGYVPPRQLCVRSEDGKADLWGVLTMPADPIDPSSVPVVDLMYAGFQTTWQPVAWLGARVGAHEASQAPAYAALGFATVVMDGRGTPGREAELRFWTQGRPETTRGLEDHVAFIRGAAVEEPALDLTKVGVVGHSFGGYQAARSIFLFPDFFTAAVSGAGAHAPERLPSGLTDWQVGPGTEHSSAAYQALSNLPLVDRLHGALLLYQGDLDENSTLDHTHALVRALMDAGKRFDLKIWPGFNHYQWTPYTLMCTWDHFVTHLHQLPLPDFVASNQLAARAGSEA